MSVDNMNSTLVNMPSAPSKVPDIAEKIANIGATAGLDDHSCFQVQVVLAEVLNNIIGHALPANNENMILLHCKVINDYFEITILDKGLPVSIQPPYQFPDAHTEGGRGWPIIYNWMDGIEYLSTPSGNHLTLRKNIA